MDFIGELGEEYPDWRRQLVMEEMCGVRIEVPGTVYEEDVRESLNGYVPAGVVTDELRTATDYAVMALFYEIANNYLPNPSSLTYTWFGFSALHDIEHPALVGLYQELILKHRCGMSEFTQAFQSRKLSTLLEARFSLLPRNRRGIFYQWFSERIDFFDTLRPVSCDIHYRVYPRSGYSQKTWPRMKVPKAYHPGDEVTSLKEMAVKIVDHIPGETCDSGPGLPMSEIAVTALFYESLSSKLPTFCSLTYYSFGFSKVHPLDQQALADLYKAVICELKCSKRRFLEAYKAGRLYNLIKSTFSKGPEKLRIGCYEEWFLCRKFLFDSLKPLSHVTEYPPSELATKAWLLWSQKRKDLTVADVHVRVVDYLTEYEKTGLTFTNMNCRKVAVVALFYEVVTDSRCEESPAVTIYGDPANWDELKEDELLRLYQTLIICLGCKVEEFLEAYEKEEIAELIESRYSQLPTADRGLYYKRWFPVQRARFKFATPPRDHSCHKTVVGIRAGDMEHWTETEIHKYLWALGCLARDEKDEFKRMSPNKAAVRELYMLVFKDYLPDLDSISYRTFGFDKVEGINENFLLGLYIGIIKILDTKLETFLEAYESGRLREFIESRYEEAVPRGSRGGYYRWFLKHRALMEGIRPPLEVTPEDRKFDALAESLSRSSINEGDPLSSEDKQLCRVCKATSTSRCGKCKKVWYCSREHQSRDWKQHKKSCSR